MSCPCVIVLGETQKFGQFFDGSLAGLTMLQGTTETERAVKCLNSCGEKLEFHAMDRLTVGMVSIPASRLFFNDGITPKVFT